LSSLKRKDVVQIVVFVFGAYLLSAAGGILMAKGHDIGGLVFVTGPFIMALVLRFSQKDWKDSGLKLKLKGNLRWYLISLLAYPVSFFIVLNAGGFRGWIVVSGSSEDFISLILLGMGMQIIPRMLFALMEEFGWRGFLDPKLEYIGLRGIPRYIITGLIWGVWHIPLIIYTNYTSIALQIFIPLFLAGTAVTAIVYGVIRKVTKSVWPAVLMHGSANTLAFAVLGTGMVKFYNPVLFDLSPGSIIMILIWIVISFLVFRSTKIRIGEDAQKNGRSG
jgi:membrane protease YdiL (CAAX protease family)